MMPSFDFGTHMQTLAQTREMDQLGQEVRELREEVTTLRAKVEKLTNLVYSLMATRDRPSCPQQPLQRSTVQNQAQKASRFDPILVKYAELFSTLLRKNLIQTRLPPLVPKRLSMGHRADLSCDFHQGAPGHDIEHCFAFRTAVQELIRANTLSPEGQLLVQQRPQQQYQSSCMQQPRKQAPRTKFDPIPMRYAELLPDLLEKNLVQTRPPPPLPKKFPAWFRVNLSCDFHQGALGHDVEQCYTLKNAVQDLVEDNNLTF